MKFVLEMYQNGEQLILMKDVNNKPNLIQLTQPKSLSQQEINYVLLGEIDVFLKLQKSLDI